MLFNKVIGRIGNSLHIGLEIFPKQLVRIIDIFILYQPVSIIRFLG